MSKGKPAILTGMQPSGELHVGNFLGALKNFVELQNSGTYDCYFFVADLHALTGDSKSAGLADKTRGVVMDYVAAGLDPDKSTIFVQSQVTGHTELAWIFNTLTPMGELERMTQFKDKAGRQQKNINVGLFDYPVLQASDILLYHPKLIPVGQDQVQHVELTRSIARWFNKKYGEYFTEPQVLLTNVPKVMSLIDPTKKMSKSLGSAHYIGINEEPAMILKKLKKAVSDSGDGQSAGGTNLLLLLEEFAHPAAVEYFFKQKKDKKIKFGELKEQLADAMGVYFEEFREKRKALSQDKKYIDQVVRGGAARAQKVAGKTMEEVRERVGLL
ncbi:tryptophan--tRNA ligase [Candidatus Falkowbacteria bacterium]|nr:tryptophan--tRNA ligase [Candidatus Falkowbacteria bacterium]